MDASDQGDARLVPESVPRIPAGMRPADAINALAGVSLSELSDEDRARGIRGRSVGYHTHDGLTWEHDTRCFVCRAAATPRPPASADLTESVARTFHQVYEDRAPAHGYETRKASAVQWEHVPAKNRALMVEVAGEVLRRFGFVRRDDVVAWLRAEADKTAHAGRGEQVTLAWCAGKLERGEAP